MFFSLTFLLKSRSDSCWSNDCLVDDCPSFSMIHRDFIQWFFVLPVNNAQLGRRRKAEGTVVLRKAWWVAQASNEQQNSFLKDFTFQWIDTLFWKWGNFVAKFQGYILLSILFHSRKQPTITTHWEAPTNLRIPRYPHHPPLAKQVPILCLGLKMGFEFGPGLKLGFLGQAQGIIFLECFLLLN